MAEVKYDPILGELREKDGNGGGGGGQENVIEVITVNGKPTTVVNKTADIPVPAADDSTITATQSNELQAVGLRDVNGTAVDKIWTGTLEQYNQQQKASSNDICIVTDDNPVPATFVQQSEKGVANGVATLDANGKLMFSQMPTLMLDSAPTSSTAGHLTQQAFVESTGKCYQLIGVDDTDPQDVVYTWAECINSSNLPTIPPATLILNTAPTTSTVGILGQPALDTTTQKTYKCTAVTNTGTEAEPVYSYTWREDIADVQVNGSSIVSDGVANVPLANSYGQSGGLIVGAINESSPDWLAGVVIRNGNILLSVASDNEINARNSSTHFPVILSNLDYCVRSVAPNISLIPPTTSAYNLSDSIGNTANHCGYYIHAPSTAPTYTLPAITEYIMASGTKYTRNPSADGAGYYAWYGGGVNRYAASPNLYPGDKIYGNPDLSGWQGVVSDNGASHECILDVLFTGYARSTSDDGTGYYAWKDTHNNLLYTSTDSPTAGTTEAYTDTALTTSAGTIALYDRSLGAISLVASAAFQDTSSNPVVPIEEPAIAPGTIVRYSCQWSALAEEWVIIPLVLKSALLPPPVITLTDNDVDVSGDTSTALNVNLGALAGASSSSGAALTYALYAGTLPTGLSLSPAGMLTGTASSTGNTTVTVQVSCTGATPVLLSVNIAIATPTPVVTYYYTVNGAPNIKKTQDYSTYEDTGLSVNGNYSLYSGTHGTTSAIYTNGEFYLLYSSDFGVWGISRQTSVGGVGPGFWDVYESVSGGDTPALGVYGKANGDWMVGEWTYTSEPDSTATVGAYGA